MRFQAYSRPLLRARKISESLHSDVYRPKTGFISLSLLRILTFHFGLEGERAAYLIEFWVLFVGVCPFGSTHVETKGPRASVFTIESLRHSKSGSVFSYLHFMVQPPVFAHSQFFSLGLILGRCCPPFSLVGDHQDDLSRSMGKPKS